MIWSPLQNIRTEKSFLASTSVWPRSAWQWCVTVCVCVSLRARVFVRARVRVPIARKCARALSLSHTHTHTHTQIGLGVCFLAILCPKIEWQAFGGWGRFDRHDSDGLLEFSSGHEGALPPPLPSDRSSLYRTPGGIYYYIDEPSRPATPVGYSFVGGGRGEGGRGARVAPVRGMVAVDAVDAPRQPAPVRPMPGRDVGGARQSLVVWQRPAGFTGRDAPEEVSRTGRWGGAR